MCGVFSSKMSSIIHQLLIIKSYTLRCHKSPVWIYFIQFTQTINKKTINKQLWSIQISCAKCSLNGKFRINFSLVEWPKGKLLMKNNHSVIFQRNCFALKPKRINYFSLVLAYLFDANNQTRWFFSTHRNYLLGTRFGLICVCTIVSIIMWIAIGDGMKWLSKQ